MTFWINDFTQLFANFQIIPLDILPFEENLNRATRLLLVSWVSLVAVDYPYHLCFLFNGIFAIILIYLASIKTMKENYQDTPMQKSEYKQEYINLPDDPNHWTSIPSSYNKCMQSTPVHFDGQPNSMQTSIGRNAALSGPPTPKTFKKRHLNKGGFVQPIYENHRTPGSIHSHINDSNGDDLYAAGYFTTESSYKSCPKPVEQNYRFPDMGRLEKDKIESCRTCPNESKEPFIPDQHFSTHMRIQEPILGDMIGDYHPEFLDNGLPVNYKAGPAELSPSLNRYNKELFTQYLQPEIPIHTNVVGTSNSNASIGFAQQYAPTTKDGDSYIIHDPRNFPYTPSPREPVKADISNVYDPRSGGYGTSYRNYIEPVTGQPRFYYDDIDSIRRPNFYSKNNIEFMKGSQKTGTYDGSNNLTLNQMKSKADAEFIRRTNASRLDIQQRFTQKYNMTRGWNKRMNPMRQLY